MVSNLASIYCGSPEPGLTKTNCETKKNCISVRLLIYRYAQF